MNKLYWLKSDPNQFLVFITANMVLTFASLNYRCFGCQVIEGYGMTETSCVISSMEEGDNLSGHVGSPNPACGKFNSARMAWTEYRHIGC